MTPSVENSAASRLCAECGLCCNGVLFHTVRIHPGDSPKELSALGLKLKRKKRQDYLLQPCPAHRESCCVIYEQRPQRCRLFECRQLKRVRAGEATETAALTVIREAKRRVSDLDELLRNAGARNVRRPLSKRFEQATAEPVGPSSNVQAMALRSELTLAMRELDALLDREFRVTGMDVTEATTRPAH